MDAEMLRARRRHLGMTQEQLAHALGVTRQSVYNWERKDWAIPQRQRKMLALALDALAYQATALDVAPAALVRDGGEE